MRKIIHVDADCFFAAVEMRDAPQLRDIPIAIGGSARRRGVISTCNYPARQFGVRSAMATGYALKLCPHLTLLPHRFDAYKEASLAMRDIFADYTDLIEPLSLDEAYLDVSASEKCLGSATLMAKEIRQRIEANVGITASAGVAANKFLAKVASDWQKPDGLTVVQPHEAEAFSEKLPISVLRGVGKVTAAKLQGMGLEHCADIRALGQAAMVKRFGSFGSYLFDCAYGRDERKVVASRERKSLSVEHTYSSDLPSHTCSEQLPSLLDSLGERLNRAKVERRIHKLFVKVKFADFTVTTLERTGQQVSTAAYAPLMSAAIARSAQAVRLLGVGVRLQRLASAEQLSLF